MNIKLYKSVEVTWRANLSLGSILNTVELQLFNPSLHLCLLKEKSFIKEYSILDAEEVILNEISGTAFDPTMLSLR